MAKIISVFNQKGGVGKTTITINLAAGLARRKKKTLVIDMDPQANCSSGLGAVNDKNIYQLLYSGEGLEDSIINIRKNLDIIVSSKDLAALPTEISNIENNTFLLREVINKIKDDYEYIIIDCPPALGLLSINALATSDSVIIPLQCEYYAMEGITQLVDTLTMIRKNLNPNIEIEGVLLNMYDKRNNLSLQVSEQVKAYFKEKVYDTIIPRNVRLAEAPSHSLSIYEYDFLSRGSRAFTKWVKEFIKRSNDE